MYVSGMFDMSAGCNVSNKIVRKSMKQKNTLQGRWCMTFVEAARENVLTAAEMHIGTATAAGTAADVTAADVQDNVWMIKCLYGRDGKVGMCLTDLSQICLHASHGIISVIIGFL